jgi:transcriptional regulator with XRE-family HTH domain
MQTMGDRIKLLREAKGLSQLDVGKVVGVSKQAVSQWESGQTANVKLQTFLRLCEVLGAKPEYLIFGADRDAAGRIRSRPSGT